MSFAGRHPLFRMACLLVCAAALYALGVGVRWGIVGVQQPQDKHLPFTLESALAFHYGELAARGAIPSQDPMIGRPEGIRPWEDLNLMVPAILGKIYGVVADLLGFVPSTRVPVPCPAGGERQDGGDWEENGSNHFARSLEIFYRVVSPLIFCAGILALFFCAGTATGNLIFSTAGALGYAILIPSVLRSTGQELMSENFSLPLLWIHFACFAAALKSRADGEQGAFNRWVVASALYAALAWIVWDMVQVYLLVFFAAGFIVLRKDASRSGGLFAAGVFLGVLLTAALVDPYLRAHGAWGSYSLRILVLGIAALILWPGKEAPVRFTAGKGVRFSLLAVLAVLLFSGLGPPASSDNSYRHFVSLFWHKLKFLNIKPADPALLPYEVRALWMPALHSATWERIWNYYGLTICVWGLCAAGVVWRWIRGKAAPLEKMTVFLGLFFSALSILFVRMEVFWIFFISLAFALAVPRSAIGRNLWMVLLLLTLILGARSLVRQAPRLGRDVDYKSLGGLTSWVKNNTPADACLLASYSLSPSIAAYARRAIVLQPKYENLVFREKIRAFE